MSFHLALPLGEACRGKLSNCGVSDPCLTSIPLPEQLLVAGAASVTLTCLFKEHGLEAVSPPWGVPSS